MKEMRRKFQNTMLFVDAFSDSTEMSELWCVVMFSRNSPPGNTRGQHRLSSSPTNVNTKPEGPRQRITIMRYVSTLLLLLDALAVQMKN